MAQARCRWIRKTLVSNVRINELINGSDKPLAMTSNCLSAWSLHREHINRICLICERLFCNCLSPYAISIHDTSHVDNEWYPGQATIVIWFSDVSGFRHLLKLWWMWASRMDIEICARVNAIFMKSEVNLSKFISAPEIWRIRATRELSFGLCDLVSPTATHWLNRLQRAFGSRISIWIQCWENEWIS